MTLAQLLGGDASAQKVVGTYLYPARLFEWTDDPYQATEVVVICSTDGLEVLITRMGGLFVVAPDDLQALALPEPGSFERAWEFRQRAADAMNLLICELALRGVTSEPAAQLHMGAGRLVDGHAIITSGAVEPSGTSSGQSALQLHCSRTPGL